MIEIKIILCPLDFSEFSIRAYRHALSLAEHYRAKLVAQHIVEVWRHPSASFAVTANLYDEYCQTLRGNGKEQLQEFVKKHTYNEIQPELVVDEGTAADVILSFAQERTTDLIVMGTHGLRGFDRLMLGSVTDRVMRAASCPVLAVREPPHDFVAAGQERHNPHRLNRILACTDFSEDSDLALNYAFSAAAEYDAELTLLHVLDQAPSRAKTDEAIAEATEQLNKVIPPTERKTLKIKTAVRIGKPYQQIFNSPRKRKLTWFAWGCAAGAPWILRCLAQPPIGLCSWGPAPFLPSARKTPP